MSQSLADILVHFVFSTKNREPLIDPNIEVQLYPFLVSICSTHKCYAHKIGGTADHLHFCVSLHRTATISSLVEDLKKNSSRWLKTKGQQFQEFSWQRGYGAFSVSASHKDAVLGYIENQKEHHKKISFQDEYRMILRKYNVAFNENYVWD